MRYDSVWFRRTDHSYDVSYLRDPNEEGFTRIDTGSLYRMLTRHSGATEIVGEILRLGRDDFTVRLMAVSRHYPFDITKKYTTTCAYIWIQSFELIKVTDLPLYMGLTVYPPMEKILKGQK